MEAPILTERLMTIVEFYEFVQRPENAEKRLELIDGVIYEMAGGTSAKPTVIAGLILYYFNGFVLEHDLGYVSGADGNYELNEHDAPMPDVAFISKARLPELPEGFFPIAPDLAVEVFSPSDSHKALTQKAKKYLAHGTRIVWLVYPDEQTVDVYTLLADGGIRLQEFGIDDMLSGGEVLPGFSLDVRRIFPK